MNTEQSILERLQPLEEFEPSTGLAERIHRPKSLARPTKKEKLLNILEERLCLGEFGLAGAAFLGVLLLTGPLARQPILILALASLVAARVCTAFAGENSLNRLFPSLGLGALAGFLAWFLTSTYFALLYRVGGQSFSISVERLKLALILEPFRFFEILLFSGGVTALCSFIVRDRLVGRPWIAGALHGPRSKKGWRLGGALLAAILFAGLLFSPNHDQRREIEGSYSPLAAAVHRSIAKGDKQSLEDLLRFYPRALEWTVWGERVTNGVNSLEMARYLVEKKGVDFSPPQTVNFESALFRAVESKNDPLAEYLLAHGADPNEGPDLPLVEAVKQGRDYAIHFLLEHGADPRKDNGYGSALDLAEETSQDKIWLILQQHR